MKNEGNRTPYAPCWLVQTLSVVVTVCCFSFAHTLPAHAVVSVDPVLFSNGMVLQQNIPANIWGTASPGESVTVHFDDQDKTVLANSDGNWLISLDPLPASNLGKDLEIISSNTITIHNVVVGEVWVCSGQSNMLGPLIRNEKLLQYPDIHTLTRRPNRDNRPCITCGWKNRPASACFWFGVNLNDALGIPIGLINRAVGGTAIINWLGSSAEQNNQVAPYLVRGWGGFYQKLIRQIQPYSIRGVLWWQGERDIVDPQRYQILLPELIRSWRADWEQGDFPFLFVQVPTGGGIQSGENPSPLPSIYNHALNNNWPEMRNAYYAGLQEQNTGMVVSIDLPGGLHPSGKELYGARFARLALGNVYGFPGTIAGPTFLSATAENDFIRIHFVPQTADSLQTADGGPIQGFEIAGSDGLFQWGDAIVDGDTLVVSNPSIASPKYVRYAWALRPLWANLQNSDGLAAAPFSTEAN